MITLQHPDQLFTVASNIIVRLLATASRNLVVLKISFCGSLLHLARAWDFQVVIQRCRLIETALLTLGTPRTPRLILSTLPQAKRNRLPFWSKIMHSGFPRLHESGLLQDMCLSGTFIPSNGFTAS